MEVESEHGKENRLGNCEVCGSEGAQYTCPRCEVKTCSLKCVKIHKKELDCSGDRDKTGFVPISKFSNLTLLSDYRLLEDASRMIDNCKRNSLKRYTRYKKQLPAHLYRLRREAYRRKTVIQYLPQHFTRHKDNTTFLHFESGVIYWRLELLFPQGDDVKIVIEKYDENERLSAVLSNFVDFDNCPEVYRKCLRFYHSTGLAGLEVLLKAENVEKQPSFFVMDMSSTLKENFEDRIIIEYPVLYVILRSHKDEYIILDPDMKVECNLEKDSVGKTNFIPFTYFDTISYSKKRTKSDELVESINSSAAELRKYFGVEGSDDETEMGEVQESVWVKKKLNIPVYEDLIRQSQ